MMKLRSLHGVGLEFWRSVPVARGTHSWTYDVADGCGEFRMAMEKCGLEFVLDREVRKGRKVTITYTVMN